MIQNVCVRFKYEESANFNLKELKKFTADALDKFQASFPNLFKLLQNEMSIQKKGILLDYHEAEKQAQNVTGESNLLSEDFWIFLKFDKDLANTKNTIPNAFKNKEIADFYQIPDVFEHFSDVFCAAFIHELGHAVQYLHLQIQVEELLGCEVNLIPVTTKYSATKSDLRRFEKFCEMLAFVAMQDSLRKCIDLDQLKKSPTVLLLNQMNALCKNL